MWRQPSCWRASLAAQAPTPTVLPQQPAGLPSAPTPANERVLLTAGRSTVLTTDFDITRIAVTNPAVADAVVVKPREVLVDGKGSGTVSLIVWGAAERKHFDLVVDPGVTTLQQNFMQLFPTEDIDVAVTDEAVILSGSVSNNDVMLRAGELAKAAMPKHSVINMLALPSGSPSKQVMLQVRFAEVNRNALQQSGLTLFSTRPDLLGRSTTQQFSGPDFTSQDGDVGLLQFSDFLNIFLFSQTQGIGGVLKALQGRGFLQSLAEPNLIAYNGQEASFLAGGEIPIPLVSGIGQVSVQYKEFGVRLTFTPTIAGDVIRLRLRPEVSTLDLHQRHRPLGLPHPGAEHPPRRDRCRAARRPVVRHRRAAQQPVANRSPVDSCAQPNPDHRHAVQEPGAARRADRADGAGHAAAGAGARSRRGADPAGAAGGVHQPDRSRGPRRTRVRIGSPRSARRAAAPHPQAAGAARSGAAAAAWPLSR